MKKIPKSITVTVRNWDNFRATRQGVEYKGNGMTYERVASLFRDTPNPPYLVKYAIDPRGPLVVKDNAVYATGITSVHKYDEEEPLMTHFTCFLEGIGWDGLRVSRKVTPIRVKK